MTASRAWADSESEPVGYCSTRPCWAHAWFQPLLDRCCGHVFEVQRSAPTLSSPSARPAASSPACSAAQQVSYDKGPCLGEVLRCDRRSQPCSHGSGLLLSNDGLASAIPYCHLDDVSGTFGQEMIHRPSSNFGKGRPPPVEEFPRRDCSLPLCSVGSRTRVAARHSRHHPRHAKCPALVQHRIGLQVP